MQQKTFSTATANLTSLLESNGGSEHSLYQYLRSDEIICDITVEEPLNRKIFAKQRDILICVVT